MIIPPTPSPPPSSSTSPPSPNRNHNRNRNRNTPTPSEDPSSSQSSVLNPQSSSAPLPSELLLSPSPLPVWLKPPSPKHPILLLAFEDNRSTILSRLQNSGANLDHIHLLDTQLNLLPPSRESEERFPSLLAHIDNLYERKIRPSFLIIDPLSAALGPQDTYFPATIARLLEPLLRLTNRHSFPLLGICHLAKISSRNSHPLSRIRGSQAYRALARSILYATENSPYPNRLPHPDQPPTDPDFPSLLIPLKNNLVPLTEAYPFTIDYPGKVVWSPTPLVSHPLLKHGERPAAPEPTPEILLQKSQLDEALHFLKTTLANGPIPSSDLLKQARALGIAQRTLARARLQLGVNVSHIPATNQWLSTLPGTTPQKAEFLPN